MRIQFEPVVPDQLYIRHETFATIVRSIFVAYPGDLSVLAEIEHLDCPCDLCLAEQEHSLALHHHRLRPTESMQIVAALINALPWPMARKHVGAAGLA